MMTTTNAFYLLLIHVDEATTIKEERIIDARSTYKEMFEMW